MRDRRELILDGEVAARVYAFAQVFPWLEVRDVFTGQRDGLARFRVAADSWRPEVQRETAEAADLDTLTASQRIAHQIQKMLDGQLYVLGRKMLLLPRNYFYQFRFRHSPSLLKDTAMVA